MSAYRQKWIEVLTNAHIPGWKIEEFEDNIFIEMPHINNLKLIRDNVPEALGAMALDINLPKERLNFIFHNGYENFEYLLNPDEADLNKG